MRVAVVAKIVAILNPLPKYFSARNLTDVFYSFLNDKAGGRNFVSPERLQDYAINSLLNNLGLRVFRSTFLIYG
jgi:hypothetical protein